MSMPMNVTSSLPIPSSRPPLFTSLCTMSCSLGTRLKMVTLQSHCCYCISLALGGAYFYLQRGQDPLRERTNSARSVSILISELHVEMPQHLSQYQLCFDKGKTGATSQDSTLNVINLLLPSTVAGSPRERLRCVSLIVLEFSRWRSNHRSGTKSLGRKNFPG